MDGELLGSIGGAVGEELKERGSSGPGGSPVPFPLPSLSQLLIPRPQVGREGEGTPSMRVPTGAGHRPGQPSLGHHWSFGNHLYVRPRSQL